MKAHIIGAPTRKMTRMERETFYEQLMCKASQEPAMIANPFIYDYPDKGDINARDSLQNGTEGINE